MEGEDYHCRSNSSSPQDPLAPLSDYAPGSSCSSWGSEESFLCSSLPVHDNNLASLGLDPPCYNLPEINWQQRYIQLQAELFRFQRQTNHMKNMLNEKVFNLIENIFLCFNNYIRIYFCCMGVVKQYQNY